MQVTGKGMASGSIQILTGLTSVNSKLDFSVAMGPQGRQTETVMSTSESLEETNSMVLASFRNQEKEQLMKENSSMLGLTGLEFTEQADVILLQV